MQPALWAVLLFDLALNLLGLNPWPVHDGWQESLTVLFGLANWARAYDWQALELMGHTWSLGIEEQFYLGWVLLWLALQKARTTVVRQIGVVLGLAMVSALSMAWLHSQGASVSRLYNGADTRIQALLLGCALALCRGQSSISWVPKGQSSWGLLALGGLGLMAWGAQWKAAAMYNGGFTLLALLAVAVVAVLVGPAPGVLGRILSWGVLPRLGAISYGLYLWHYPLYRLALHIAQQLAPNQAFATAACLVCATALTWGLAEISHRWLETPVRRMARRHLRIPPGSHPQGEITTPCCESATDAPQFLLERCRNHCSVRIKPTYNGRTDRFHA